MSVDPASSAPSAASGPLRSAVAEWKGAASRYLAARLALFRIDAGEAAQVAGRKGKLAASGVVLLLAAYGLLWAGVLGLVEQHYEGIWPVVALVAAACHLLVGVPLLVAAARKPARGYFEQSLQQWKEYELWMKKLASRGPRNPTN